MLSERLEGLVAAPLTPMAPDGRVNLDAVEPYAALLARSGVAGAFVAGTTGEGLSLTVEERLDLARRWVEVAPAGFKVIVHVGHTALAEARALARQAAETGADAIGAMPPCFFRPETVDDLVAVCAEVASAAPGLPFYYYHIPALSGVAMPMADFLEAAAGRLPTLVGMKYTWEDLSDYARCLTVGGGRFDVLFGHDEMLLGALATGARGAVGSTYNFAAPLYLRLIEAWRAGDMDRARELQGLSCDLIETLKRTGTFLAACKTVMKTVGIDCGPVRLPLRNLAGPEADRLLRDLERLGLPEHLVR